MTITLYRNNSMGKLNYDIKNYLINIMYIFDNNIDKYHLK